MAENVLKIDNFNELTTSNSNDVVLQHLREEAFPEPTPIPENETLQERTQRKQQELETKQMQAFYQAAQKNPDTANVLYHLRESALNEFNTTRAGDDTPSDIKKQASLRVDDEGQPYLKIYKRMEGSGLDFSIYDGKVVFNSQMSDEKMAEVLDFLYRRGITSFELPRGLDEQKIQAIRSGNQVEIAPANTGEVAMAEATPIEDEALQHKPWVNPNKPQYKNPFEKAVRETSDWLKNSQAKRLGSGYYVNGDSDLNMSFNGNVTFSVYDNNNNTDNYKNDGKKDKDGHIQEKGLQYRLKLIQKDGNLGGLEYYVPNNGKIPDAAADQLASLVKSRGALYMDFPKGVSQGDAGVFRMACARAGIIPKGISINEKHARKMLNEAETSLSDTDLLKYKGQLGRYLMAQTKGDKSDRRYKIAESLINQEKFTPFQKCFDDFIKPEIEQKAQNKKAEEIIGSAFAAQKLFQIYEAGSDMTFTQLMSSNLMDSRTKQMFMQGLQENNIIPNADASLQKMSPEQLKLLFNALSVKHTEEAKADLNRELNGLTNKRERDETLRDMVADARNALSDIVVNLDAKDLKGSRTPYLGNPKFTPSANYQAPRPTPALARTPTAGMSR